MKKTLIYILPFLLVAAVGCKKDYLEVKPNTGVTEEQIFSRQAAASAALDGIYKELFAFGTGGNTRHDAFGQMAVNLQHDLMGNDMVVHSLGYGWFTTTYNLTEWANPNNNRQSDYAWLLYYDVIKQANKIINNADAIADASAEQIENFKGQGYGLRAYAYYNLINNFQQTYKGNESKPGVPIYTQDTTGGKPRATVQEVYSQIISDLTEAERLLEGKSRSNKMNMDVNVVQGFRARVALVMEDWQTAATYANKARSGYAPMSGTEYVESGFSSINNAEWMWGSPIPEDQATIYASFFSHMDITTGGYAALGGQKKITKELYDQIPEGDVRKDVFTTPGTGTGENPDYNQVKFRVPNPGEWAADYVYMRAAEMYLIEAEALAHLGQDAAAIEVLEELVQTRYPDYSADGLSGEALIEEILLQRRIELWGEGFSLIDIKRLKEGLSRPTGAGNHGAPNFDPGVYTTSPEDPRFLMRIPQRELDNNASMTPADQNP